MKVSVVMITYNHERFIAQAIESVLMQKADFDFELVIGDDCSTDKTREIILEFKKNYPDKIRLLLREKNVGMHKNFTLAYQTCQSEYVAFLDGDDYWTSPNKLQEQVDFMESNPECSICFHDVTIFNEAEKRETGVICSTISKEILTIEDILVNNYLHTSSILLRSCLIREFPDWFYTVMNADNALYILFAQHGKIGYINKVMAAYRVHSAGVWSGLGALERLQELIKTYELINSHLNYQYRKVFRALNYNLTFNMAFAYEQHNRDMTNAKAWLRKCINKQLLVSNSPPRSDVLKMIVRLYCPNIYKFSRSIVRASSNLVQKRKSTI